MKASLLSESPPMQDSEVSDGGEEEVTTSQSSASMQVFAAVMVFSECSLNNRCHFCRILKLPYQALILLQICGSTTCPTAVQLLLRRWLGWSRTLLLSACQVLKCKHNSLSKLLDSSYLILTHLMRLLRWLTTGRKRGMRIGQSSTLASKVLRGKEWPLWKKVRTPFF